MADEDKWKKKIQGKVINLVNAADKLCLYNDLNQFDVL